MNERPRTGSTSMTEDPPPAFEQEGRFSINEDWAATIFGLVLLLLVLAGIITGDFMKGLLP